MCKRHLDLLVERWFDQFDGDVEDKIYDCLYTFLIEHQWSVS